MRLPCGHRDRPLRPKIAERHIAALANAVSTNVTLPRADWFIVPVPSSDRPWRWTSSAAITVLSGLSLVLVTLADWLISPQVAVLTAFLALATLLAASVLGPGATGAFAV